MPESTVADPAKPAKAAARDTSPAAPAPAPARNPFVSIALGVLSVILLIVAVALWMKLGVRDEAITQNKNRSDQVQADTDVLRAQLDESKAATAALQKKMDETKAAADQSKAELDKVVASSA